MHRPAADHIPVARSQRQPLRRVVVGADLANVAVELGQRHAARPAEKDPHQGAGALRHRGRARDRGYRPARQPQRRRIGDVDAPLFHTHCRDRLRRRARQVEEERQRMGELPIGEPASRLRILPRGPVGPKEGGVPFLEAARAGEDVAGDRDEAAHRMFQPADRAIRDAPAQRFDLRQVVVAVGDQEMPTGLARERHQRPGLGGVEGHRLLAKHMRSGAERRTGMLEVQLVRGGDDHDVRLPRQHLAVILRPEGEAEMVAHPRELRSA